MNREHSSNISGSVICTFPTEKGNSNLFPSLSEALRQTNLTMKERFEGLTAWREKQREERDFLEGKLEEARVHMEGLTLQNQELSKKLEGVGGAPGGSQVRERGRYDKFSDSIMILTFYLVSIECE